MGFFVSYFKDYLQQMEIIYFFFAPQLAKETISRFKEEIAKVEKEKGENINSTIFE
jgi:hypothetical protein